MHPSPHSQPSIKHHSTGRLLVCSLPHVWCSLLWRPPRPAEHPQPQLPQGTLPASLPPVHSRATGKLLHPKGKPQTPPPRQQPAHGVPQGTAQRTPALLRIPV